MRLFLSHLTKCGFSHRENPEASDLLSVPRIKTLSATAVETLFLPHQPENVQAQQNKFWLMSQ